MRTFTLLAAALLFASPAPSSAGFFTNTAYLAAEKAHDAGRFGEARARFEKLLTAKDKDVRAIAAFRLHDYYDEGLGVAKDRARALHYLKMAAVSGSEMASFAHWRLGHYYELGHDGSYEVNRTLAAEHYLAAKNLGDKDAAKSLERLEAVPEVFVASNPSYFSKPADDIAPGGLRLGFTKLQNGDHLGATNILEWHARRGDAQAQYALAVILSKSGVPEQQQRAKAWSFLAAKGGWPEAQRNHGIMLYRDVLMGEAEAKTWLRRASQQGDHEAENFLGVMAANPRGKNPPDFVVARGHFSRAVEMGNSKAFTNLGDLYAEGLGVAKDETRAKEFYSLAAEAGELEGRNRLFTTYGIVHKSSAATSTKSAVAPPAASVSRRELSPVDLFASVSPSVLTILALSSSGKDDSQGSAVSLGKGEAVTNCHVLKNADVVGTRIMGKVIMLREGKSRPLTDLCLLHADGGLTPVTRIRSFNSLRVGERVYAVGSPSGLQNTFTEGLISGLRTEKGVRYIQTSAAISPGSSGGGLFDIEGRLIGITSFMLKDTQGLNFAVSIEELP